MALPGVMSTKRRRTRFDRLPLLLLFFSSLSSFVDGLSLLPTRRRISFQSSWRIPGMVRGGGSTSSSSSRRSAVARPFDDVVSHEFSDNTVQRERGMSIALFSAYFSVMGAKCALPSVLSLLVSSNGLDFHQFGSGVEPQQLMAKVLTLSTIAIALGKLVLGPIIDTYGGITSLQVALTILALLLGTIASCSSFATFAVSWVLVDFIFSSCWAACINAVHQCFGKVQWARKVGMLAAAARTGNAAAFCIFASVLRRSENWRMVFWVSATMQVVPIALLSYFGRLYKRDQVGLQQETLGTVFDSRPSVQKSITTLQRVAATPEFWLHFLSRSSLMVYGSFLLFVPTLMTNCYGATSAFGAQCGSIFALGCLLSVTLGAQFYAMLPKRKKIMAAMTLLGMATLSALGQWGHMSGAIHLSCNASAALLFLWGFSFAIPFYIPPSLYALARGGVTSSATIADVFDFGGFGLLAIFNGYVASIRHNVLASWIPSFQILTGCSLISLVSLSLAIVYE